MYLMMNETLIRLKDTENENDTIASFYTEKPYEFLKLYNFCKKEDIPLKCKGIEGQIEYFEVHFGYSESLSCIDIWLDVWRMQNE